MTTGSPSASSWRRLPWRARYQLGERLATRLRQLVIEVTHLHCTVRFEGPVRIGPGFRLWIPDGGTLIVGPGADFRNGFTCEIHGTGRVTIGPSCTFTSQALIQCSTSIDIGTRCTFGQSVMIVDGNHRYRDHRLHLLDQGYDFRPIHIGDGATVATKVTIINDLGPHCFVGANSVVTKPVPAYCLAAGVPAKVLEYYGPPGQEPPGVGPARDVGG